MPTWTHLLANVIDTEDYVQCYYYSLSGLFWFQQDKRFKQLMIDTALDGIRRELNTTLDKKSEWICVTYE